MEKKNTLLEDIDLDKEWELIQEEKESRKTKIVSDEEFKKLKANDDFLYMAQMKKFAEFCQSGVCQVAEEVHHGEEES